MNLNDCIDSLVKLKTFSMFTPEQLRSLMTYQNTTIVNRRKNSLLFLSGEPCETLNVVLEGEVAIQQFDNNGNYFTITTFKRSQSFGENLLFGKQHHFPFSIIAKTDCVIVKLNKNLIFELLQTNGEFLKVFLENVSDHSFFVGKRMINLTGKSLREKIIDYIKEEQLLQQSHVITLDISKKELAEKFGVHRPSLSRELKKMKLDGLIEYDHTMITPLTNLQECR